LATKTEKFAYSLSAAENDLKAISAKYHKAMLKRKRTNEEIMLLTTGTIISRKQSIKYDNSPFVSQLS